MRNIETFPSKQMYPYPSLVERKVAEFYHNIDKRCWLVWSKWFIFITFSGQLMVSLVIDYTGSVEGIYAIIYCTKWRSGQVSWIPYSMTTLKDSATQLLKKYKSGALATQSQFLNCKWQRASTRTFMLVFKTKNILETHQGWLFRGRRLQTGVTEDLSHQKDLIAGKTYFFIVCLIKSTAALHWKLL